MKNSILVLTSTLEIPGIENIEEGLKAPVKYCNYSPPPAPSQIIVPILAHKIRQYFSNYTLSIGSQPQDFDEGDVQQAEILILVDGPVTTIKSLSHLFRSLKWIHTCLAGIDQLVNILKECPSVKALESSSSVSDVITLYNDPTLWVTNSKGAFSSSLKEYVLATILYYAKQMPRLVHNKEEKIWDRFIMGEIRNKTVGFIGFGDIAKETAKACRFLGMKCIALKRNHYPEDLDYLENCYYSSHEECLQIYKESDYVVSTLPETELTKDMIGKKQFTAMKPNAIFISVGRGSVINEDALYEALEKGYIRGAALDVFHTEPLPKSSRLWTATNLVISSHNADWCEDHNADTLINIFQENFIRFINNVKQIKDMYTPVDIHAGY